MPDLPAGISQRDVAELLGVSVSTVSRALANNDRVSDLTKRAVRDAYATLAARTARSRGEVSSASSRPMLGVTLSDISDEDSTQILDINFSEVLAGIGGACQRAGLIPYPWHLSRHLLGEEGEPFLSQVIGVITVGGVVNHAVLEAIKARGLPVVVAGGQLPGSGVSSVGSDNATGIRLAVEHLVALGHRRIALVNGPNDTHTSIEKMYGYLWALAQAGIPFDASLVRSGRRFTGFDEIAGDGAATDLLSLEQPPTAIVCAFDQLASGVYRAAARLGFSIPGDLSVVGYSDDDTARHAAPPMTTVHVDRGQWGEIAMNTVLALREPGAIPGTHTLLPVHLVVRSSTAPPGTDHVP
ncbi:MAG TPA: LacI family DNA-binding transcriptional regulator [Thermomicrobiales bacterium]|jgi:DNA-binding LacI/PurR family transcriptional regulator|nr:LacI family DNA-binding transcriptional regulator [Thermomicrobiales bacterium]